VSSRLKIVGALAVVVALVLLSIFVVKPPKPIIEIKGEVLIHIAGSGMMEVALTNTLLTAWLITGILIVLTLVATKGRSMIPSGMYNGLEAIVEGILNFVTGIAGETNGRRFFPLIATLFIYIAFANWISLTPVFNTFGMFVPLHADEEHFHDEALVFKDQGISLLWFGAKNVEVNGDECAAGSEGDAVASKQSRRPRLRRARARRWDCSSPTSVASTRTS